MKVNFAGRLNVKMIIFYVGTSGFDKFPGNALGGLQMISFLNITILKSSTSKGIQIHHDGFHARYNANKPCGLPDSFIPKSIMKMISLSLLAWNSQSIS